MAKTITAAAQRKALARGGFDLGTPRAITDSLETAIRLRRERDAGIMVFDPAQGRGKNETLGAMSCPRCHKPTAIAMLTTSEKAGYCVGCRYTMPIAGVYE